MTSLREKDEQMAHRSVAEIDLAAIRHNLRTAVDLAGGDFQHVMAVVKADAYGHGLPGIVRALNSANQVGRFGVASLAEARAIRKLNASTPVVILGTALESERLPIVEEGLEVSLSTLEEALAYQKLSEAEGARLKVHAVVDTGMGRMGFLEKDSVDAIEQIVSSCSALELVGLASHFPSADEDQEFTREQAMRFLRILDDLAAREIRPALVHIENSAGLLTHAGTDRCNLVRAGLMLYGISPIPEAQGSLRPALSLKSHVTLVRDIPAGHGISYGRSFITSRPTTVATISIGYGDGYPRHLSGSACDVLIRGKRCPLLGRVTMDQIMADVSGIIDPESGEGVRPGDEVTLIGRQGSETILATELADKAGTIAWEIFTGITRRVPRVYLNATD